jgi:hypothetical protein
MSDIKIAGALRILFDTLRRCSVLKNVRTNEEGNARQIKAHADHWYIEPASDEGTTIIRYDNTREPTCSILRIPLNHYPATTQQLNNFITDHRVRQGAPIFIFHARHGDEAGALKGWKAGRSRDNVVRLRHQYNMVHTTNRVIPTDSYPRFLLHWTWSSGAHSYCAGFWDTA